MDVALGISVALLFGLPAMYAALHQSTATPPGYRHISVLPRVHDTGPVREVGASEPPPADAPTTHRKAMR